MAEKFVTYDPNEVLEKAKKILEKNGYLPFNCPKKTCLYLSSVNLTNDETTVFINTDPPRLPSERSWLKYELNPICKNQCRIFGNSNRGFELRHNSKTGKILSAKGQ